MTDPDPQSALEAFHRGGGMLFPFRKGYAALARLLDAMPSEAWRRDESVMGGLILYLVKQGQAPRALSYLRAENLAFEKTYQFGVLDLLLALHLGERVTDRKLAAWRRLERNLPLSEPLLLGLYYNAMMAMYVRFGRLEDARVAGQQAISCYREDGHAYLEHFIHIHLADMDVVEGRLRRALRGLTVAERCLAQSGVSYGNETEVIEVIRLAVDYERGALARVREQATRLRNSLVTGDSWSELFFQLARISVLSVYFLEGREAAQQELMDFQADYARRHSGMATTVEVLNAMIWRLEWHPNEAEQTLGVIRETPIQSALGEVLLSEVEAAMGIADPDETPDHPATPRAAIVAALHDAQTSRGQARNAAIERALRIAFEEGQIAPFLENRDVFLGVSSRLASGGFARSHRKMLRMTNRVLRQVEQSYVLPEPLRGMGFNRRQYRVAAALQSGATNKQVARQLGTTEATVKYHLTSLYRLAGVRKRTEFIDFMDEIL